MAGGVWIGCPFCGFAGSFPGFLLRPDWAVTGTQTTEAIKADASARATGRENERVATITNIRPTYRLRTG